MNINNQDAYREDLAYIHDVGFDHYVLNTLPGILDILKPRQGGLILDLGCGSGLSTQALINAGYQAIGIDISAAMIEIARRRVPQATFYVDSLFKVELPRCWGAIAIGECLNYCFDPDIFDPDKSSEALQAFFQQMYAALTPGGHFIFDLLEASQSEQATQGFAEGDDWLVLYEKQEDRTHQMLTRRITTLRKVGQMYRRDDETHQQRLYLAVEVESWLRRAGFDVATSDSYGLFKLPPHHRAFVACKPAR
ncbi:MAG: class I SAM-dependent methyltransferase [Cyanobacteria bacterium J06635_1]